MEKIVMQSRELTAEDSGRLRNEGSKIEPIEVIKLNDKKYELAVSIAKGEEYDTKFGG